MKETADYRPLLSTWFALDYHLGGGAKPFIFQSENFVWFGAQLLVLALLFRCIPGGNYWSAIFGAFLFALHPITADTVNYPLQRGVIMGSFGVTAGLLIWIFWPRWLPQRLPLKLKRVPEHGFDEYLRHNFKRARDPLPRVHPPADRPVSVARGASAAGGTGDRPVCAHPARIHSDSRYGPESCAMRFRRRGDLRGLLDFPDGVCLAVRSVLAAPGLELLRSRSPGLRCGICIAFFASDSPQRRYGPDAVRAILVSARTGRIRRGRRAGGSRRFPRPP